MKEYLGNLTYSLKVIFHRLFFFIFKLIPIEQNKVVFINLHSSRFTGNNKAIYEELKKRDVDFKYLFISLDEIKMLNMNVFKKLINTVKIDFSICTAKYIILNDYYSLFSMITIRAETELIQVWHAGGAFKKFGRDSIQKHQSQRSLRRVERGHAQYTKVIVSSREVVAIYANAFGISEERIYPIGIPRADIFFDAYGMEKVREKLFKKHPALLKRRIILYAPTFRDDERYLSSLKLDVEFLLTNLHEEYILILKMHPFERGKIKIAEGLSARVFDLSHEEINELLIIADILITDYSSLIFEYAILNKPMLFFAYDLDKYENKLRGFYYRYVDFVPGPIAYTTEEVLDYIKKDQWDEPKTLEFAKQFNEYFDGKATARFIDDVLFEGQKNTK